MIVDRWLAGRFLRAYLLFTGSIGFLFLVVDLLSNSESLAKRGFWQAAFERYASMLPELFFMLSPHLVLLAGLWTVVTLIRSNELVPLYAAGYSPRRLCAPLLVVALGLGVLAWADRELLLPQVGHLRRSYKLLRQPRLPVRPISDGEGGILSAQYYVPSRGELVDPRYTWLNEEHAERATVLGTLARYDEAAGGWRFFDARRLTTAPVGSQSGTERLPEGFLVPSDLRKRDVEASIKSPGFLSAAELREQLQRPGFAHLEVQLYERYTQPLAGVALLLLGLPVVLGAARGGSVYMRGLGCLLLGAVYFVGGTICYELGTRGVLPPLVAAGLPLGIAVVAGGLAFWRA